jgi:hypothetical protein
VVEAALHLLCDESFKLLGEGHVHRFKIPPIAATVTI